MCARRVAQCNAVDMYGTPKCWTASSTIFVCLRRKCCVFIVEIIIEKLDVISFYTVTPNSDTHTRTRTHTHTQQNISGDSADDGTYHTFNQFMAFLSCSLYPMSTRSPFAYSCDECRCKRVSADGGTHWG